MFHTIIFIWILSQTWYILLVGSLKRNRIADKMIFQDAQETMLNVHKNIREREKDTQIKIQKTYVNKSEFADENVLFFLLSRYCFTSCKKH